MANLNIPFLLPQGSQFNFNLDPKCSSIKYSSKGAEVLLGSIHSDQ